MNKRHLKQMKAWRRERRVVNFPIQDFIYLKRYCDAHGLNMARWLVITAKIEIDKAEAASIEHLTN